ncbi:MAG: cytochrome c oxidase subunit 3 family protein [Deferribacteres bacterium]|nr:cytochrome c oxidase subunit 3 family protein [candidate division KSB1 bacterium]MCB9511511.1 cytochrome c oxidase subunit 3 family protein [Deferribacteres bacterium]
MEQTHAADHPKFLQHHFVNAEQQSEASKFGLWIFLLTEILLFGGLFCAYAIYRAWHPDVFYNAHRYLDVTMGATNTAVLIFSSLTVALSIRSIQLDKPKQTVIYLAITILCAATFMVIKYFEYSHKFHLGLLPGKFYTFQGIEGSNPHVFFSIYFMMTGLHGLHVLGGMFFLGWVMYKTIKGAYSSAYYTPVELGGLYWHLVDLIWIYLFPLLYLIG